MPTPLNEFKHLTKLIAEALGKPGHRTFRIMAESGSRWAVMWVEKEQLLQLSVALRQLLVSTQAEAQSEEPSRRRRPRGASDQINLEFKVGKILLGHDSESGNVVIDAHDVESEGDGEKSRAVLRVWVTRAQAEWFSEQSLEVCAAGRPICPLCGGPINPEGHVCPSTNGHYKDARQL